MLEIKKNHSARPPHRWLLFIAGQCSVLIFFLHTRCFGDPSIVHTPEYKFELWWRYYDSSRMMRCDGGAVRQHLCSRRPLDGTKGSGRWALATEKMGEWGLQNLHFLDERAPNFYRREIRVVRFPTSNSLVWFRGALMDAHLLMLNSGHDTDRDTSD